MDKEGKKGYPIEPVSYKIKGMSKLVRFGGMNIHLSEKLNALPSSPGVYLMKDSHGHILYVGKAKNLKKRVQTYFQHSRVHSSKVKKLVHHLKDFDLLLTDTEFEAFMLECRLIQELQPPYNRKMKNPKAYSYIVIRKYKELPVMEVSEDPVGSGCMHSFGPFTGRRYVEKAVQGIKDVFGLNCSGATAKHSACLNHSLGLCMGICLGGAAVEAYTRVLDRVIALLQGEDTEILQEMNRRMLEAAERFEFEAAAKYRDCIDAVSALIRKEKVIEFTEQSPNIAIIEYLSETTVKLFLIKRNVILFSEKFVTDSMEPGRRTASIRTAMIDSFREQAAAYSEPKEIARSEVDEAQIIYSYLQGCSGRSLIIPDEWLDEENARCIDAMIHEWFSDPEV